MDKRLAGLSFPLGCSPTAVLDCQAPIDSHRRSNAHSAGSGNNGATTAEFE